MAKKRDPGLPSSSPKLRVPRRDAEERIQKRIDSGNELLAIPINDRESLKENRDKYDSWDEYNFDLLRSLFDSDQVAQEYRRISAAVYFDMPLAGRIKEHYDYIRQKIRRLESVSERLELFDELVDAGTTGAQVSASQQAISSKVFIVHGHDEAARESVARFVANLGLEPVILHETASGGSRTIIEKIEGQRDVGYAIVLLTPDDAGGSKESVSDKWQPRARQNVVFELGFFIGALGREKVSSLYKSGVELPTDYAGIVYIPLDDNEGWQMKLARELKTAGLPVDLNKVI